MFQASDYHGLLQQLDQFFAGAAELKPVAQRLDPAELRSRLCLDLPEDGKPLAQLQSDVADYLTYAVKTAHPAYFNQLWGGFSAPCFMGEMLTSATNTSMYTYEVAPVATLIENTLIAKLGQLAGFSHPEGQFTAGGSSGNLLAMAIARHRASPALKQDGMTASPRLVALVSEEAHYSFVKAAQLLGLGAAQLRKVPADGNGKMKVSALAALIAEARAQGEWPFFVAGTAGTTVRGAYDPFAEIAAIAQREGLWFHVDGAWGASVLLSPSHRHLMQGVDQADSLVWDAHKMMGMTLMCSVLLVKQRGAMLDAFSAHGTDYLFHAADDEPLDLGLSTPYCGRRVDALKLWLTWKHLGDRGWAALIDRYFSLAAHAEAIIDAHPSLALVTPRQSLNLCFQYRALNRSADALTQAVRQALWEEGLALVNYAQVQGHLVFRLVICNNQTTPKDLEAFFEQLVAIAQRLDREAAS